MKNGDNLFEEGCKKTIVHRIQLSDEDKTWVGCRVSVSALGQLGTSAGKIVICKTTHSKEQYTSTLVLQWTVNK